MKILAISDMHGDMSGLKPNGHDLVLVAGDFAPLKGRGKWHIYEQKKWIQKKFVPFMESYPGVRFVVVPGNHDIALDPRTACRWPDVDFRIEWPENCSVLIDSLAEIDGLRIYGTPWVPIISYSWAFEAEHDRLVDAFQGIPDNLDILITHTPPRFSGYLGDVSLQFGTNSTCFGSQELANAIFVRKPKYVFCGHIHSGDHDEFIFEDSRIYNVSYVNESYDPAYDARTLEI